MNKKEAKTRIEHKKQTHNKQKFAAIFQEKDVKNPVFFHSQDKFRIENIRAIYDRMEIS